jgi:hypothetical protein
LREQKVTINGVSAFNCIERTDSYLENDSKAWNGGAQVTVAPGSIVTLTNVEIGKLPADFEPA